MLRQRVLTALALIPLVTGGVLWLGNAGFALLLAAITLLGAWEWARLGGLEGARGRSMYVVSAGLLLAGAGWLLALRPSIAPLLAGLALAWWSLALGWVIAYQASAGRRPAAPRAGAMRLLGLPVLLPAWTSLVALHGVGDAGPQQVLYLLLLIWVADSGAYFAGRRWGRRKLALHVSPGKSWEGVAGALLVGGLFALVAGEWFGHAGIQLAGFVALALAVIAASVLGDLFESLLKRYRRVKDSGSLLPGHGGVLDRIDSLTAAAPLFLCGYWLLGGYA